MATTSGLRHGHPEVSRNDTWAHDKYTWPNGLELFIYDDGRVKIGKWNAAAVVGGSCGVSAGSGARNRSPAVRREPGPCIARPVQDQPADRRSFLGDIPRTLTGELRARHASGPH